MHNKHICCSSKINNFCSNSSICCSILLLVVLLHQCLLVEVVAVVLLRVVAVAVAVVLVWAAVVVLGQALVVMLWQAAVVLWVPAEALGMLVLAMVVELGVAPVLVAVPEDTTAWSGVGATVGLVSPVSMMPCGHVRWFLQSLQQCQEVLCSSYRYG
jgi:hypothetical protein